MGEIGGGSKEEAREGLSAKACLFLIMLLILGLIAPAQGMAHQAPAVALSPVYLAVGELRTGSTLEAEQPSDPNPLFSAGLGIGCSLAGLDVPAQSGTDQVREPAKVGRPLVRRPVLDVARAPPNPPPILDLRFQTD